MRWIRDNEFKDRYQFWTRANVAEVLPEPPSPLGWDTVWEGACVAGWRDLFIQRLGMPDDELDPVRAEMVGIFGGYAYLGAALFRVWAGRTPGMTPTTIDDVYFGEHPDVPPYVAEDWHANARTTEVMGGWLQWATVDLNQDELEADRAESLSVRAARPDLTAMSDGALLGYVVGMRPLFRRMFHQHINQSIGASVGPGILAQVCTAIGQPHWAMRLMAGLGGVDSATPSYAMWELSRSVAASPSLTELFDAGTDDLYERARTSTDPDIAAFSDAFAGFLAEYGSRGANEWDLMAAVWEVSPATALAAIDRMRAASDDASPLVENAAREAERHDLEAKVREALAGNEEALGAFTVGLNSAGTFIPGRERSKTTIIRVIHEARMAVLELGRRFAASGTLDDPWHIFMLFADELEELVAGNLPDAKGRIPERLEYRAWLSSLEPPFIINGHAPPNSEWARKGSRSVTTLAVGETITGVPGCPGTAQGRARVILDPADPSGLEPGDVLVAPATDPSWTPLFVPAAAVVVNVGAALSHAVIVSRELGIPCVPSAVDATLRIPDGALISVDGDNGTVTLVALPT
jgi:pyruvate,water dikinase